MPRKIFDVCSVYADREACFEMTPEPKEIGSGKDLAAKSPEIDFAVVLSRVIGSIEDDPAQLRNAVYELARLKLRREAWQRDPPLNLWEARHLIRALESAIERVETIYSKHDELKALRSLDRLIESSEIEASDVTIKPRAPLLIVDRGVWVVAAHYCARSPARCCVGTVGLIELAAIAELSPHHFGEAFRCSIVRSRSQPRATPDQRLRLHVSTLPPETR
jgi:hypothetical protein